MRKKIQKSMEIFCDSLEKYPLIDYKQSLKIAARISNKLSGPYFKTSVGVIPGPGALLLFITTDMFFYLIFNLPSSISAMSFKW